MNTEMYEWYRQRDIDRLWEYILHEDWLIGENIQFSWRRRDRRVDGKYIDSTYNIYVRKRRGIFGCGCTDWYYLFKEKTFEDMCKKLNKIIKQNNEQHWLNVIAKIDQQKIDDARDALENKFCGFGSKKAIGWSYK